MAERGQHRTGNGLGNDTKAGLAIGGMLTLGTLIAILIPTVGPKTKRR